MDIKPTPISFEQLSKVNRIVRGEEGIFKSVGDTRSAQAAAPSDSRDVIVLKPVDSLDQGVDTQVISNQVAADLKSQGASVEDSFQLLPGASARVSNATAQQLEKQGYLVYDNSRRSLVPGFPRSRSIFKSATDMPKVDAPKLLKSDRINEAGYTGKGVTVAVIDSGFQHEGTQLKDWKDIVDGSSEPIDPVGHGTHCAGDVLQTAPDAQIVAIRVMNEDGQGRPSDIIRGIQYAVANKAKLGISVINMSLGGPTTGNSSASDPIDQAVEAAIKKGIAVVDAAGNDGPKDETVGSPADDPLGITVGSALNPKTVSDFSSRGPTGDGLQKPDVIAPGEFIVSWNVAGSQMDQIGTTVETLRHMPDDKFLALLKKKPELIDALGLPANIEDMSPADRQAALQAKLPPIYKPDPDHIAAPGTSFASPLTAGIVADLRQALPALPPQGIKDLLVASADKMDNQFDGNAQGAGFINAEAALKQGLNKA